MIKELMKWNLQLFADGEGQENNDNEGKPHADGDSQGEESENNESEKKYTDEEVNEIVDKKFSKWKKQHEKELEESKKEAEKLAKMNADQKKDYELEKAMAEITKLRAEASRIELGKEATKILKENKIEATQNILDFVVGDTAESTKGNIEKFVEVINHQVKLAEIERSKGKTPNSYGASGNGSMKKEDIMKMSDAIERQKAIAENINLFN